jgi:hypothetical protein
MFKTKIKKLNKTTTELIQTSNHAWNNSAETKSYSHWFSLLALAGKDIGHVWVSSQT